MTFLVTQWKYFGIILFLILTGCGLPLPEEIPIVAAGVLSAQNPPYLNPWLAYVSCIVGALIGDAVMYAVGYHWGHNLLKAHPRIGKFLHAEREEKFEQAIQKHGLKVMLFARFLVGIRGPVYLAAGVVRMPFKRFILMDLIAATLVVTLFFSLAYFFGESIYQMIREAEITLTLVVLTTLSIAACYFLYRKQKRRITRSFTEETANGEEVETKE